MSDGIGTSWGPRGAWDDIIIERSFGAHVLTPGVIVHPLSPGVATLMLNSSNTRSKAGSRLPVDLPATGTAIKGSNFDLVWIAPGQWLTLSEEDGLAQRLQDLMGDGVAVADQTGARATARLSGTCVRKALAKGCPIDLDSRAFPLGSALSQYGSEFLVLAQAIFRRIRYFGSHLGCFIADWVDRSGCSMRDGFADEEYSGVRCAAWSYDLLCKKPVINRCGSLRMHGMDCRA